MAFPPSSVGWSVAAADVRLAPLTPATDDVAALTVSGAEPTVLAFALLSPARGGDPVAYEALNLPEPHTYVYRTGGADPRGHINQALDDVGFAAAEISAVATDDLTAVRRQDAVDGLGSRLVRDLVATVPHTPDWAREIAARLDG